MRKVIIMEFLSIDGVMQAPGGPEEDPRDGFQYGGWVMPYHDEKLARMAGLETRTDDLLLGRRTYEIFAGYWPDQADDPTADWLNRTRKYVASTTLQEPLAWHNSRLLQGDVHQSVAELKREAGEDLLVFGSGEFAQTLMQHQLVDQYVLMIFPLILGSGHRLFPQEGTFAALRLVSADSNEFGVLIATYEVTQSIPEFAQEAG